MEPLPKRQRLFAPAHRDFAHGFNAQHEYYEETADSEMLDEEDEELEDEPEEENDPETELEQRRARLDYKLKSTFEAIFEKYGKDFDGVGDEIDLATGEILVNNGHLSKMQDERDAGDVSRVRNALRAFTAEPDDLASSSMGETELLDEEVDDEDEDEYTSEDDMVDDDMILRGFAKANRFVQAVSEFEASPERPQKERNYEKTRRPSLQENMLPTRSEILLQFGPQLGPHIAEFITQQQVPDSPVPDDSHIEPAWRVPKIPSSKPPKRPVKKPVVLLPEPHRSPSPEAGASIWAPAKSQNRRAPKKLNEAFTIDPLSEAMGFGYDEVPELAPKRSRKTFTAQDDQILLKFAEQARRQNLELGSISTWRRLEAIHPGHSSASWKSRYNLKFTYLWPNETEEPESSETSIDTTHRIDQPNSVVGRSEPSRPKRPPVQSHPTRIRKPAEKDSRIMSWSQAVDAIESVDPDLHAGFLEDSRMMEDDRSQEQTLSSSFRQDGDSRSDPVPQTAPHRPVSRRISSSHRWEHVTSDFMTGNIPLDSSQSMIPSAPCPHADCRSLLSNVYRLQRQEDEDLSEMCLHLFHQHHTTPFPCGEVKCPRKGEEGFFMQVDLVRHVRLSHPNTGALQRLRGRVNPELLDSQVELTSPHELVDLHPRPKKQRDSDFMSPSQIQDIKHSSNPHVSSSSGGDRTITPRMRSGTIRGAESTPMTSISSMMVHPTSGTTVLPIRNSQPLESPPSSRANNPMAGTSRRQNSLSITPAQVLGAGDLSDPFGSDPARSSLPTPQASIMRSLGPSSAFPKKAANIKSNEAMEQSAIDTHSESRSRAPLPTTIPDSQASISSFPSSSFDTQPKPKTTQPSGVPESFFRPIDPSYVFSDEEDEPVTKPAAVITHDKSPVLPQITTKSTAADNGKQVAKAKVSTLPGKQPRVLSPFKTISRVQVIKASAAKNMSAKNSSSNTKADTMLPPTTPASKAQKDSAIQNQDDDDDDDEDELSSAQFGMLSHLRTNPQPKSNPLLAKVQKMGSLKTPQVHSAPSGKRKLNAFQEPTVDTASLPPAQPPIPKALPKKIPLNEAPRNHLPKVKTPQTFEPPTEQPPPVDPVIKAEADDLTTLSVLPSKKTQARPRKLLPPPTTTPKKSPFGKQLERGARTSTPLLDLTPSRRKVASEIQDSDEDEESSPIVPASAGVVAAAVSAGKKSAKRVIAKPPIQTQTQPRMRHTQPWEKAPIVLRTPGGTLRKCGEDGFRCRKGFCFACGIEIRERETSGGGSNGDNLGLGGGGGGGGGRSRDKGKGKA